MDIIRPVLYFSVRLLRYLMPLEQSQNLHPTVRSFKSKNDYSTTPQAIEDWYRHMLDRHTSLAELVEWQVTEMRWYKNTERLEHEFVVFAVQASNSPNRLFLRFDRRSTPEQLRKEKTEALVKEKDDKIFSEQEKATMLKAVNEEADVLSKRNSVFNALKSSSGKADGLKPADTITSCRQPNGTLNGPSEKSQLLVTYSNFRNVFTLRDLAIIAGEICAHSQGYLALMQQCYWMARTLVNVSVAMYEPQPMDGVKESAFSRAGRLSNIPFIGVINADNHAEVNILIEQHIKPAIEKDNERLRASDIDREAKERLIKEQSRTIAQRDETIAERDEAIAERDETIAAAEIDREAKARMLEEQSRIIAKLEEELRRSHRADGIGAS